LAKRALQESIAAALEEHFEETRKSQPELLAQHFVEGGVAEKAITYWLKAGQLCLTRSALVEAVAQLRKGLNLIESLPESAARLQQELDLQIALGKAMIATKGYAAPETGGVFDRALSLCKRLHRPSELVSVLHGQWVHVLLRGDLALARRLAEEMLELGVVQEEVVWMVMGCRMCGVTCCFLGEFIPARDYLERGLLLYDPGLRSNYVELTVDDMYVVMISYLAWTLL
jgi:tetratricopeptide (TPR) repeat protein